MTEDKNYQYHIDLDTFYIPHDKERDYRGRDPEMQATYIPPYDHYRYKSIYEGIMIEIHLVNHCNLNCNSCNHFSPLAKPWFITKESLQNSLQLIKDNIPNVKNLILLGGEPTLHPELLTLCRLTKEMMPEIEISVMSNGKNLTQVLKDSAEYEQLGIHFAICDYPTHTNHDQVQELIEKGIGDYVNTRILMSSSLVNSINTLEDPILNFYNCSHHMLPCFTVEEDKLFVCPFASHSKHYFQKCKEQYPITKYDYLNIADIQGNIELLQDFIFTPKPICAYCRHASELREFKKSSKKVSEYCYTLPELYVNDYNLYESLMKPTQNYFRESFKNINSDYFRLEDNDPMASKKLIKRYVSGKIDIIIPYYNLPFTQLKQLENTLLSQSIIDDCVIYLISDNSPDEKEVFATFHNHSTLNCILLKNIERQGPGVARNKGIEFSCNDYIFMLDADDYFSSSNALENLYNLAKNQKKDVIYFQMPEDDTAGLSHKTNFLLNRQFMMKHSDIKFPPYYYGEDFWFMTKLHKYTSNQNCLTIDESIALYGTKNNETRLSNESNFAIPLTLSKLLYILINSADENLLTVFNTDFIQEHQHYLTDKTNEYMTVLIFYIFYKIYQQSPSLLNNIDLAYLIDLQDNVISIPVKNKILRSEEDLQQYLYNNLNDGNIFIKPLKQSFDKIDFYKK